MHILFILFTAIAAYGFTLNAAPQNEDTTIQRPEVQMVRSFLRTVPIPNN